MLRLETQFTFLRIESLSASQKQSMDIIRIDCD